MEKQANADFLSPDKPLKNPEHDQLGYAPFAKHIAESICKMTPPEGLVIAIYAPWGSGKTTVLNFIEDYIERKTEIEQPVIVHFNPWWFSGQEDLIRHFFDQLCATLKKTKLVVQGLTKKLSDFVNLLSEIPTAYSPAIKAAGKSLTPKQKDVPKIKAEIAEMLRKSKKRILIIVDDIDRLTQDEIREIFRLIKSVADFPNIAYLLAFDKDVVISALNHQQGMPGESYLEKIVQLPLELPYPDKLALQNLLFEKFNAIFAGTPQEHIDSTYWGNVFYEGIESFLKTPRDIIRLSNVLALTYPAVKGEVNLTDFIAIQTLQVFCPVVYEIIRTNKDAFTGHADQRSGIQKALDEFHSEWVKELREEKKMKKEEVESIQQLLTRLFPKLESIWGNTYYGHEWEAEWNIKLRICSPEKFPIYFRLSVPESSFSNAEMKTILTLSNDVETFSKKLLELSQQLCPDGTTRVRTFLEQFMDYIQHTDSIQNFSSIVEAFFQVGDQLLLPQDAQHSLFDAGNEIRISRILYHILKPYEENVKFTVLKEAIPKALAISVIVWFITALKQEHGENKTSQIDEKHFLTTEHLQEIQIFVLTKIQEAANKGTLFQTPLLPQVLYFWKDHAWQDVKQWVQQIIQTDEGLCLFIAKFLQKLRSQAFTDKVARVTYRMDPKWLEPFLNPAGIIDRARKLAKSDKLTGIQKLSVQQFIEEYDLRQHGEDPSDF